MKLDKDFQDLLSVFNDHGVKYLVVGGYAVGFHDEPRGTKDFDVWIQSDEANGNAVYRALAAYGAPISSLRPNDFKDGKTFFQLGVPPNRVDVMQTIEGVEFESAWARRAEGKCEEGIPFNVISKGDLIQNKETVGRPQDLIDAKRLRKLA